MTHFSGIDVSQSRTHISISTKTYLDTVFNNYSWDLTTTSLPMNPSNDFFRALNDAKPLDPVEHTRTDNTRFRYRAAIGELIWPMITTRPKISYPVVKLSQFSSNPAKVHYDAVYGIFKYLFGTRNDGFMYNHKIPTDWGHIITHVPLRSQPMDRKEEHTPSENLTTLYGYSDSDWAMDIRHRHSISGMAFFLGGEVIAWKTRVQPTVSLSTAESEFLAASDSGRLALFIRAVMTELGQSQLAATTIYEDNDACIKLAGSAAPTRQMRHIAIRDFTLQDWTDCDLVTLVSCPSNANASDMFAKQVGNILFVRHTYHISGGTTFFCTQLTLLAPRLSSGARGVVSVPLPLPGFTATPLVRLP
jgi:hypothetical protein